jgi:dTDP-glucose 4,6-dehydratase
VANLLVTGGAGFIGANFVHRRSRRPEGRIVVLDALTYAGNLASLAALEGRSELRFVRGDICDRELVQRLLREERIDTIVHFAAETHVDRSILGSDAFMRTNVLGTHALLEAARSVWLGANAPLPHRFHHVSTDEVYGSLASDSPGFIESSPYAPNSPYAASKAASDHLVRAYHRTYGLNVTTSNCSNNYGPYHFPEKLIPLSIVNILEGRPLPVYGDGRNVRDWLHVNDHCQGIELVLTHGRVGEIYNIGGHGECENLALVQLLCEIAQHSFASRPELRARFPACPASRDLPVADLIRFVPDRPGHDRRYAIDCGKIERELGFAPTIALRQGLADTFQWYLDHEAWWRGVMDGSYRSWLELQYGQALKSDGSRRD